VILAETNRAPFDFVEGESELVRGFNVEYGGFIFAIIFMAEYLNILFISVLTVALFLGAYTPVFPILVVIVAYSFVWARAAFPRYRYDLLISLTWVTFLPMRLSFIVFFLGFSLVVAY
jgi:NADH-quinone oxidoreductase subunit H